MTTPEFERRKHRPVDLVVVELHQRLGERISTMRPIRESHGRGEGVHATMPPDAVVFAESTDEVALVLEACNRHRVPIIPFGAGTSLEGQVQAIHGGISLDLSGMNRILAVRDADLDCHVEAGVTREALNKHLRDQGLFFPLDPGANATLGGMAATRASGTNAVRYGTMREVTLGLTVVTPTGQIVRTGTRARKSSCGYDLTRLYLGSEGTLGVITELNLRLFGIPECIRSGVCQFDDLSGAVHAVTLILQMGIAVARVELLDSLQMQACINYSNLDWLQPQPTLFFEFHGSDAGVADQIARVAEIVASSGGRDFQFAAEIEDRNRLWKARHNAYWASRALRPGCESIATDACVPISELARCILESCAEADAAGLVCPVVGHVGDGNFHMLILFNPEDASEIEAAEALARSVALRAIACGGTATGEHGVGIHKLDLLAHEHQEAIEIMVAIKQALDPAGIMNPGKTVPI